MCICYKRQKEHIMDILLLIITIIASACASIFRKPYTQKVGDRGVYFFTALCALTTLIFFVCSAGGKLTFTLSVLPYSLGFAATYLITTVCAIKAVANGPFALTALITSFSCILPAIYGLIFLNESVSIGWLIGIVLLVIALVLVNGTKKTDQGERKGFSLKWLVYCVVALVCNGGCSIIQKAQQVASNGSYKSEFMIMALTAVILITGILALTKERSGLRTYWKCGWLWALLSGISNGAVNLLVMILTGRMSSSVIFPLLSACGIILTTLTGILLYHEKHTKKELLGFLAGIASVVFLNL